MALRNVQSIAHMYINGTSKDKWHDFHADERTCCVLYEIGILLCLCHLGKLTSKFEEARTKYNKSTGKLHRAHNDYILLLREVTNHQKHYLQNTLPSLLEYQETCLQNLVKQWWVKPFCTIIFKKILEDISPLCGATDTPVVDFWRCLPGFSKPGRIHVLAYFINCFGFLRFTCGAIPADLLAASMAPELF